MLLIMYFCTVEWPVVASVMVKARATCRHQNAIDSFLLTLRTRHCSLSSAHNTLLSQSSQHVKWKCARRCVQSSQGRHRNRGHFIHPARNPSTKEIQVGVFCVCEWVNNSQRSATRHRQGVTHGKPVQHERYSPMGAGFVLVFGPCSCRKDVMTGDWGAFEVV